MASYRQLYYHIVFGTKYHKQTIPDEHCQLLYKYIWGIIENKKSKLYRINGGKDHLHLLVDIHPTIALSTFVKDIKVSTSLWLKEQSEFNHFEGWTEGFAAFTISHNNRINVIEYIKNQKEHHKTVTFRDEYEALLKEFGIKFDEKNLD
jgi:REP element-mobilizing transposase RayT